EVLAFAYRPGWSRVWSRPLSNPSPLTATAGGHEQPVNLAYAQARVFNPTAWDLWTQDWHVKLVPAKHLAEPAAGIAGLAGELDRYHEFAASPDADQARPIQRFYERFPRDQQVVDEITNH